MQYVLLVLKSLPQNALSVIDAEKCSSSPGSKCTQEGRANSELLMLCRFLCAMHPDMRGRWAEAWARQIMPGGELVTLMFPVDAAKPCDEGPPFPLTPALYTELLSPHGEGF